MSEKVTREQVVAAFGGYRDAFEQCVVGSVPMLPRAVTNVEGFYWWALVGFTQPDMILESGVCHGRSTLILAKAQRFYRVRDMWAFECSTNCEGEARERLKDYRGCCYWTIDSKVGFAQVAELNPGKRILAIIDGPKGPAIRPLLDTLVGHNVVGIGCHDLHGPTRGLAFTAAVEQRFPGMFAFRTDPQLNSGLRGLNDSIADDLHMVEHEEHDPPGNERWNYVGIAVR